MAPADDGIEEAPDPPDRDRPDKVAVPRLVGLTLAEARQALRRAGLRLHTGVYFGEAFEITSVRQVVSTRPPGTVLRQSIAPHTQVRVGREVRVVLARAAPGPCDDSYPDVCIPLYPPDLDCPQVGYVNIRVVGSDPHDLDGYDNDGVGCEA
jgi:beta-lactam-binding protein with PASTA domain